MRKESQGLTCVPPLQTPAAAMVAHDRRLDRVPIRFTRALRKRPRVDEIGPDANRAEQSGRPARVVVAGTADLDRHVLLAVDRVDDRRSGYRRGERRRLPEGCTRLRVDGLEVPVALRAVTGAPVTDEGEPTGGVRGPRVADCRPVLMPDVLPVPEVQRREVAGVADRRGAVADAQAGGAEAAEQCRHLRRCRDLLERGGTTGDTA